MATFITGGTGFLGSYLLAALLRHREEVSLHVRCRDAKDGLRRIKYALSNLTDIPAGWKQKISIYPGDLVQPQLGLSAADFTEIINTCDSYIHCAASVRFDMPLEKARAINVNGTQGMLDLIDACHKLGKLHRLDVVSTAYVAGKQLGVVAEKQHDANAGFKNTYEQSKYEAEKIIWQAMETLPICLHRPSIVVGEASTGRTTSFSTIYTSIRMYKMGVWRTLPANKESVLDIVPVDFVRDAILEIRKNPDSIGRCFHLTAGKDNALRIREIVEIVESFFPSQKKIRYQNVHLWQTIIVPILSLIPSKRLRQVVPVLKAYLPYTADNPIYDDSNLKKFLKETDINAPNIREYISKLLNYAVESNFGQKSLRSNSLKKDECEIIGLSGF